MLRNTCILFVLAIILSVFQVKAQELSSEQVKSAYLFAFARHMTWENEEQKEKFTIGVIGDRDIHKVLEKLALEKTVKEKRIKIYFFENTMELRKVDMLFLGKDFNYKILDVNRKIDGQNTLLVSDQTIRDKFVMVNFVKEGRSNLRFEVNRVNIEKQGLDTKIIDKAEK